MGQEFRFEEGAKDMANGVGPGAGSRCCVFQGMTESIAPMCSTLFTNLARICRIPVGSGPSPEAAQGPGRHKD
jgi:hypothetical protein